MLLLSARLGSGGQEFDALPFGREPWEPMSKSFSRALALALLAGTVLLGAAAVIHPVLRGDASSHLRIIADAGHWRAVHFTMLLATALVIAGLWVRLVVHRGPLVPLLVALLVITVGLTIHSLNLVYMAGAGWQLATRFAAGEAGMAALYDVTHPIGLMASRYGNLLVALGAVALGWVEWRDEDTPDVMAWLAWAAAVAGIAGVAAFHESTPAIYAAVAVLSLWQVGTAGRVLLDERVAARVERASRKA